MASGRRTMAAINPKATHGTGSGRWQASLAAARTGDVDALGLLVQSLRHYLILVARQETAGELAAKGGASDLVQETFLVAQRRFGSFSGGDEGQLKAWLRAILRNRLAKFHARYATAERRRASREVVYDRDLPAGELTTPSVAAQRREEHAALDRAMALLPEHHRRAVLLRHQQGLRFDQIAAELGTTPEAARKYWARGVERLRSELGPLAS